MVTRAGAAQGQLLYTGSAAAATALNPAEGFAGDSASDPLLSAGRLEPLPPLPVSTAAATAAQPHFRAIPEDSSAGQHPTSPTEGCAGTGLQLLQQAATANADHAAASRQQPYPVPEPKSNEPDKGARPLPEQMQALTMGSMHLTAVPAGPLRTAAVQLAGQYLTNSKAQVSPAPPLARKTAAQRSRPVQTTALHPCHPWPMRMPTQEPQQQHQSCHLEGAPHCCRLLSQVC
jgi:hypothetical protein